MHNRQASDRNHNKEFICGVVEGFYGRPWSFDQRKDLFKQLKEFNLNSFMYAPKDDTKHRAKWRQLYSESEANALKELIDEAKLHDIDFYYSLAPGLDIVYSDKEEIRTLINKFDQLVALGCKSFAILFDDIEPRINEKDEKFFNNYASAQVSVTNTIHEHLNRPKFLFCPTEYCESRAVPNVPNSVYLNTIGTGLHHGIDIMWSGCRVVSRLITEESIEMLTNVIRRPPLIWENLHANDYDKKRVFLGPYSGRSTKIIPKLRGVLTNPNCEYEVNYIAIHTLAQWSKCSEDINLHNRCNPDHGIPNENIISSDESLTISTYDPNRALRRAIRDWLPRVFENKSLPSGINLTTQPRNDEAASGELAKEDGVEVKDIDVEESNVEMVVPDELESSENSVSTNKSDMDTSGSPTAVTANNLVEVNSCDSCEMLDASANAAKNQELNSHDSVMCSLADKIPAKSQVDVEGLSLLADLFYLPFEHGPRGYTLLKEIKWLIDNSDILISRKQGDDRQANEALLNDGNDSDVNNKMVEFWFKRAESLNNLCACISQIVNALIHDCPNKLLSSELYPYLAEMRDLITVITDYIKYLHNRTSSSDQFYFSNGSKHKESASTDEQEPWVHRGGLIGDVQRLLF